MTTTPIRHVYKTESGKVQFTVVRHGKKRFELLNSRGRKIDGFPDSTVLYRLPELLASNPREKAFVVEGEKDADRLADLGLIATTNPGGCQLGWKRSYNDYLRGRHVILIRDNDKPGIRHAEAVCSSLRGTAKSVTIIALPRLQRAEDVSDWLDYRRGTLDELLKFVASKLPPMSPIPVTGGKAHQKRDAIFRCSLPPTQRLLLLAIHHRSKSESILTAGELSEMTGLHRVTVQRMLGNLRARHILRGEVGQLTVDFESLVCF